MASGTNTSLAHPPQNLKEAMDWVARVYGFGGLGRSRDNGNAHKDLAKAVENHINYNDLKVTINLEKIDLEGLIEEFGQRVGDIIGFSKSYIGVKKGQGIAVAGYTSSYQTVQWVSTEARYCTIIFLAVVPLITFALGFLRMKCNNEWNNANLKSAQLNTFLTRMGFEGSKINGDKSTRTLAEYIGQKFPGLNDIAFPDDTLLDKIKTAAIRKPSDAYNNPLAKIFYIVQGYLTSETTQSPEVRCRLVDCFNNMVVSLHFKEYPELDSMYSRFLNKITAVHSSPHKCPVFSRIAIPSLTVYPRTLKETIDWMTRVHGFGGQTYRDASKGYEELSSAVDTLINYSKNKNSYVVEVQLEGLIDEFAKRVGKFIGYIGGIIKTDGIASTSYTSSYRNAKWNNAHAMECVPIFLEVVSVITIAFCYLHMKCKAVWHSDNLRSGELNAFFKAVGFDDFMLNRDKNGSQIVGLIEEQFPELKDMSFTPANFVSELQRKATNRPGFVSTNPLAKCFHITDNYLTSKSHDHRVTIDKVLEQLKVFGPAFSSGNYSELNAAFEKILKDITPVTSETDMSSHGHANESASASSSVGAAAGGVIGTAAVGGAGATVALDLGGVKTMIKSAIDILR
ncbi:uncharacterized protein BcabD6B2_57580 [Babesia caballi]|uniref:Uncharacterized protein n=1 Tax=Babesia caballi TaxID=5871 RepID=A0AAV4M1G4_BABCB|nr:hypothetical protein, conserved [Babesia caballi]